MPSVLVDRTEESIVTITFNRPDVQNAFTFDMYHSMLLILREIQYDISVRVVILTGAGRGFCSGHDVKTQSDPPWADDRVGQLHRELYAMQEIRELPLLIRSIPQPVIAAVNGSVAGIGALFVLAADLAIAARSAKFVNAFHNTGVGTEGGVSYLLSRAVGTQRAAEILLTERTLWAEEAARIGLVLKDVPDQELMDTVLEIARAMVRNTPLDNWLTKQSLHASQGVSSYADAIDFDTRGVILARMTADVQERRAARAEGRQAHYRHT